MSNLIDWYMKGFNDELNGSSSIVSDNHQENLAYSLGALHALIGDDVRSWDDISDEDILKEINNKIVD